MISCVPGSKGMDRAKSAKIFIGKEQRMARNEPSLAELLADDTGNLRPEAARFLMTIRPARVRQPRNQPHRADQREARPLRWIGLILTLVFFIMVVNALSGKSGKEPPVAVSVPKIKSAKALIKTKPEIAHKPVGKINQVLAKPMVKPVAVPAILVKPKVKTVPVPAVKAGIVKPAVKMPSPAPKRQERKSQTIEPAALGYNFFTMERLRNIEAKMRKKVPKKRVRSRKNQGYSLGIKGPG